MGNIDWGSVVIKAIGGALAAAFFFVVIWLWDIAQKAGKKSLEVGQKAINHAKDQLNGVPDSSDRYDDLYSTAYKELKSDSFEEVCWAKAFAHSSGDQDKTKALYIKYRVEQLKNPQATQLHTEQNIQKDTPQHHEAEKPAERSISDQLKDAISIVQSRGCTVSEKDDGWWIIYPDGNIAKLSSLRDFERVIASFRI